MNYPSGPASIFSDHARQAHLAPKAKCPHCGEDYTLGVDGTVEGCDECTKTERLPQGFVLDQCTGKDPIRCDDPNCTVHGKGGV